MNSVWNVPHLDFMLSCQDVVTLSAENTLPSELFSQRVIESLNADIDGDKSFIFFPEFGGLWPVIFIEGVRYEVEAFLIVSTLTMFLYLCNSWCLFHIGR